MATQITATLPTLNFPREVDYPTQEDWAAFSAAAELNFGILGGSWSTQMQLWKTQANAMSTELNTNVDLAQSIANYQGDWTSKGYTLGQSVSVSGIYYICKLNHATGQNPTTGDSLYWNIALGNWNLKVNNYGNETIDGTKTFISNIVGNITGNSATTTKLATSRTINGVSFNGSANISVGLDLQTPLISTSFTLDNTNKNKLILCNSGITINLPTINTIKSGDLFYIKNEGLTPLTLALNGNSTNLNTLKVTGGETLVIQSDGGSFYRGISRNTTPIYDFDTNIIVQLSYNTVFQADADLTLVVICSGSYANGIEIVTGATTSPIRTVSRMGDDISSNTKYATLTAVITAGLYFKVQGFGEGAFEVIEIIAYRHK